MSQYLTARALVLASLLLPAGLAGCSRPAADAAASEAALRELFDAYVAASNQHDAAALAALYEEDALLLPPDQELLQGRPAIEQFWTEGIEPGLRVVVVRVVVDRDVGWIVGRYGLPPTATAAADIGKMLLCARRQPDGHWLLSCDIWNGSLTEPGTSEAVEDSVPKVIS